MTAYGEEDARRLLVALRDTIHQAVPRPREIFYMGAPMDCSETLAKAPAALGETDFLALLDADDAATYGYYLPYHLGFLLTNGPAEGETVLGVFHRIVAGAYWLEQVGVLELAVRCLVATLESWLDRPPVKDGSAHEVVHEESRWEFVMESAENLYDCLGAALEHRSFEKEHRFAAQVLESWFSRGVPPAWSVYAVDAMAKAVLSRRDPEPILTYANTLLRSEQMSRVLDARDTVRFHCENAVSAWDKYHVPQYYRRQVRELIQC